MSACATCDGFFFRGKRVAVVGGGNTAVEEALYLTNHAESVTLIHRRDSLRAEKILQRRLFANPKVRVVWDSVVEEITRPGTPPTVTACGCATCARGRTPEVEVDGVFVAIGHTPNTAPFRGQVAMDAEGYILTRPEAPAPRSPVCSRRGTCRTKCGARRSPPLELVAWRRWKPKSGWPAADADSALAADCEPAIGLGGCIRRLAGCCRVVCAHFASFVFSHGPAIAPRAGPASQGRG